MKKEYVTVRLFKHNRATDGLFNTEELLDLDQAQSTEVHNNSVDKDKTIQSSADSRQSSLPQRLLDVIKRALGTLGLQRKD